jgi:hypothetical protein
MNFIEIAKSWIISINPSEDDIKKSNDRISICNSCEHRKDFLIYYCDICSCPLQKKIYSKENTCPLGKWNF